MNKSFVKRLIDDKMPIVGRDKNGLLYLGTPYACVRFPADTELPDGIEQSHVELIERYSALFEKAVQQDRTRLKMPSIDEVDEYTKGYRKGDSRRYDFLDLNPKVDEAPVVNALYLRNILDLYSKKDIMYCTAMNDIEPLLFWNEEEYARQTQALLFPLRRKK